jgi:hypothetical protein
MHKVSHPYKITAFIFIILGNKQHDEDSELNGGFNTLLPFQNI